MTEYFVDGCQYVVKSEVNGKWYASAKHVTALWVEHDDGKIECINISEIEKRGRLVDDPRKQKQ